MKEIGSIVIGIALGLVTSIVSNYATNYAKKRKTLFLSIFFALTASAIALAAWPEPQKQANVNIMNAKVDYDSLTAPAHVNDNKGIYSGHQASCKGIGWPSKSARKAASTS